MAKCLSFVGNQVIVNTPLTRVINIFNEVAFNKFFHCYHLSSTHFSKKHFIKCEAFTKFIKLFFFYFLSQLACQIPCKKSAFVPIAECVILLAVWCKSSSMISFVVWVYFLITHVHCL